MPFRSLQQFKHFSSTVLIAFALLPVGMVSAAHADDSAKPAKDILVFTNGETLLGKLDHVAEGNVYFKSDNVGKIKVKWSNIKTLHTAQPFAVLEKGALVKRRGPNFNVPVGPLTVNDDTVTVNSADGKQKIPITTVAYLVDNPTFEKNVLNGQGLVQGITGSVAAGISLVYSTQNSESINTAVSLTRRVPAVSWLPPQRRTSLNFNSNYGEVTQSGSPAVKTNVVHGALEQDEYFTPHFYVLQEAVFDHNFSQGLDLQQIYGIGVGYTAIKRSDEEFDLSAIVAYTKQQLSDSIENNLIGSSFADNYIRKLPKKIVFTQSGSFNPAWNSLADYSANLAAKLTFPVYQSFGFTVGLIDNYLNNPATGFEGNSVQFNTGLIYTVGGTR